MENNTQKHISSTELGALEFKEGDLHYALQHVSYSGELFKDENGKISAQIIISDKFNFDSIRTITDGISLSNVANDFGMVLQTLGMIQEFSIRIEVEMDDI